MNINDEIKIEVLKDPVAIYYGQAYLIDLYEYQMGYQLSKFEIEIIPNNDELLILKCSIVANKNKTRKK